MGALREFVADVLESEGAAVEPIEPDELDVLAPEPLCRTMGWPELVRLGFGPAPAAGVTPIRLEGDWLDRFGALIGDRGRFAERLLVPVREIAAPGSPERLIERAVELPNAIWRLRDAKPAWARCLLLAFRYTAASDEKREGLVWIGFNCTTSGILDDELLARLRAALADDADWQAPQPEVRAAAGAAWDVQALGARAAPLVEHRVRSELEPFLRAMRRRVERDRARVHAYHDDLRRTAQMKLAALRSPAGDKAEEHARRETMRIAAIEREYAAKIGDLRHNFALRVTAECVQGLVVFAPVHRYELLIKRRKGERTIAIDWHPAARLMELPPCDWGAGGGRARLVCDERLHLTDAAGEPCPSCGKPWCRACDAACPRCKRSAKRQGSTA
jgi:hypothetical protein